MLYDFVVIGNTIEAILAAINASYLKNRVALVYSSSDGDIEANQAIFNRRFTHLNNTFSQYGYLDNLTYFTRELIAQVWGEQNLAKLASMGIDVIIGDGEFCRLPKLGFVVNNRTLRSPFYLIATGADEFISGISGGETVTYLREKDILEKDLVLLPDKLLIIGRNTRAVSLAQNLRKIGKNITLVVEEKQLLPQLDRESSLLIQAQLESEGIKVFIDTSVSQFKEIEGKKWVQVGHKAIAFDEIIITSSQKKPRIDRLNLEGVRVKVNSSGIVVNEKLQTTNKRIYACGSVIGNNCYFSPDIETKIVVNNALGFPCHRINHNQTPLTIYTSPPAAKIGLTETEARSKYKDDLFVAKEYFKNNIAAQILEENTGFCKLIVRKNGEILGAQIVGAQAEELIAIIALAMNNKVRLGQLVNSPLSYLSLSKILIQTAQPWEREQIKNNKFLLNILDKMLLRWLRN